MLSTEASQDDNKGGNKIVNWERTKVAVGRLIHSPEYSPPDREAPYGRYTGRPIIGSSMPKITGGVYLGKCTREAIVVDDTAGSEGNAKLREFYERRFLPSLRTAMRSSPNQSREVVLDFIYKAVVAALPYSEKNTKTLIRYLTQGEGEQKIHLASFLLSKTGVCRHQALLVGYLIEKLTAETDPLVHLDGVLSVERNTVADLDEWVIGAHAWTRYTTPSGEVWIIDAARKCFGRLADIKSLPWAWEYKRPNELLDL